MPKKPPEDDLEPANDAEVVDDDDSYAEEPTTAAPAQLPSAPAKPAKQRATPRPAASAQQPQPRGSGSRFSSRDADILWPEILAWLPSQGETEYNVRIAIVRMDPPPEATLPGYISGVTVRGSDQQSAAEALVDHVSNYYHLPLPQGRGTCRYQLRFVWATNSRQIAVGELCLPPAAEIMAMRQAQAQAAMAAANAGGAGGAGGVPSSANTMPAATGVGKPQPQVAVPPPSFTPQLPPAYPFGFGYPQTQQPPADINAHLLQMIGDMWRAGLGAPQAPVAPPTPPVDADAIASKVTQTVLTTLQQMGLLGQPQQTVAAVQPTMPKSKLEAAFDKIFTAAIDQVTDSVQKNVKAAVTGVGKPPEETEEEEEEEAPPPTLPWNVTPVGEAKWSDGRPVLFAADRKTGELDIKGALFANPALAEAAMGSAQRLVGAITEVVKGIGSSQMPERAPPAVVGMGQPQRVAPPQAPPQIQAEPKAEVVAAVPSNTYDATDDGWKNE